MTQDSYSVGLGTIVDDTLVEAEPTTGTPTNCLLGP
jgi:hypothetical protein